MTDCVVKLPRAVTRTTDSLFKINKRFSGVHKTKTTVNNGVNNSGGHYGCE